MEKVSVTMIQKIKRILSWLPVLWKTHVWGYDSLLVIMQHQLKLMEYAFREHGMCVGCEKRATEFHLAQLLIQRIVDEAYTGNAFEVFSTGSAFLDYKFEKRPMVPKQKIWEYEGYMKQQDLELLCQLMNKKLFDWWD